MKKRNLLWGVLACVAFSACSNDEGLENEVLTGGDSYVSIRLVASNGDLGSRGSAGDPEFELGTSDEAKVTNAHFYFYDAAGNFVVKGETLSSIADNYPNQSVNNNIETKGNVNIVLRDVTKLPSSVLVVLNMSDTDANANFQTNLTQSYQALAEGHTAWGYTSNGTKYFTMTNSSYMNGTSVMKATPVSTNHLQKTEDLAMQNPITIYVERMAAKVQLKTATNMTSSATANVQLGTATDKESKTLAITVDAWGLNGVNNTSFYMKDIDGTWNYTWWKPTTELFRTYWAKDANYESGSYPTDAADYSEPNADGNVKKWSLKYFTASEITTAYGTGDEKGKPQYCLENTLAGINLSNFMTSATHVILLATMKVGDATEAQDLFNYKGVLYDTDNYKKVALADLIASKSIGKKTTTDGGTTYTEITVNDIEVKSLSDGKVTIGLTAANLLESTWYSGSEATTAYSVAELNVLFDGLNAAEGYKNGQMYYTIPIEHLASTTVDNDDLEVGDYGVVRNHFYTITVNKIENLGKGIYEPTEVIVPNYDPETYYVAATLNVLSWKTVSQNVDL